MTPHHAFALGTTFSRKMAKPPGLLESFLRRSLGNLPPTAFDVWSNFEAVTLIDKSCRLGPHAFAYGPAGEKKISLAPGVICRGLLRREHFGDGEIIIEEDCYIGDDVILSSTAGIRIGARTLIAQGVEIFDNDTHPLDPAARRLDYLCLLGKAPPGETKPVIPSAPIEIGEDCWIGSGAFIGKGVQIGPASVIAARSVVTHNVPPHTLVVGNPARPIRELR